MKYATASILLLSSLLLLHLSACAPKVHEKPTSFVERFGEKGLKLDGLMDHYASFFRFMEMEARVKVSGLKKSIPSIKTSLALALEKGDPRTRAAGFGPFGVTLFDALVDGTGVKLCLPRHKAVYVGPVGHSAGSRSLAREIQEAWGKVLNPWLFSAPPSNMVVACPAELTQGLKTKGDGLLCFQEGNATSVFTAEELLPLRLHTPHLEVEYSDHDSTRLTPAYPRQMKIRIIRQEGAINVSVRIQSLLPSPRPADVTKGFDGYFTKYNVYPLELLLAKAMKRGDGAKR